MIRGIVAALLLLICAGGPVIADDVIPSLPAASYPKLVSHGASVEAFVPAGWRLETKITGDLNGDGRPDAVLVLRDNDPKNVIDRKMQSTPRFDTNPRILAVAFADGADGYDLVLENHTLIARTTNSFDQDPLDPNGVQEGGIEIKNGTLQVTLGYFGGNMGHITYTFRFQHNRFEMIGYDRVDVERARGVMTDVSVNYSTRQMEHKVGHISDDKDKVTRTKLPAKPLLTLQQVGDGLVFEPSTK